MIKKLLNKIASLILYFLNLFGNALIILFKKLKFSIAFKISASYFLLYIVVILIVAATTSTGYFIYQLSNKEALMDEDAKEIISTYPNIDQDSIILNKQNISSINIYDENLNQIFTTGENKRYSNNIITNAENILLYEKYVYSELFFHNNLKYYVSIYYHVNDIINDTAHIIILILISGLIGLLIFAPIVSRTSYKLIGPIKNMTQITKTITVNNINTRLDIKGTQDELKELSQTFNDMMDRIEEGYQSQQQFVSDASHELRTPIAVIKGYVNMLDRWGKNDKAILEESISAIKNETDSMQDLIEKLLFIARSDKHTLTFTKEDFSIKELLSEIEKETKMIDSKHNFFFHLSHDASLYADRKRIKQAVRILLENAIKFTPHDGNISVHGFIEDKYYVIKVSDTGIGIAKKDLNKVFDRLYRAEQSRSKEIGGHGLGLSIAKIIVLGHKGKIKVKSTLGKGSEFSVMLPFLEKIK